MTSQEVWWIRGLLIGLTLGGIHVDLTPTGVLFTICEDRKHCFDKREGALVWH